MHRYNHRIIEQKWQQAWMEQSAYVSSEREGTKVYVLDMFPYPSADGLHVGHPEGYTATDIVVRKLRAQGKSVLHPMGWDAFGLPAENYAIKTGTHPATVTNRNIARFKEQIQSLGLSYDWTRELSTTDPAYYRWTQWIFLQLYKRGLAYEAELPIWWCPTDKTGLANEEVVGGKCDRCGSPVERRTLRQWVLKITEYADRLLDGLDELDWPESIKTLQRNWIGRSEGAKITFRLAGRTTSVEVFTTRPDTLYGVTYLVLAPEHPLVSELESSLTNAEEVLAYTARAQSRSDLERQADQKGKTGVQLKGVSAIHPLTGQELPIWIADYVLTSYGTGAIMAVPAHDERDFDFAKNYQLPIIPVVEALHQSSDSSLPYLGEGVAVDSDFITGLKTSDAKEKMIAWLEENGAGIRTVHYKLRDWVFSRQRYWGEPIPLVHCPVDGIVPIPESQLPVTLPDVEQYEPTGTGESPLAGISSWVNTTCPTCGGPAKRETNTMPQWAGSCWYYLRFTDPKNDREFASEAALKSWLPVDIYVGGAEHAVLHLLYARFWHKVLYDAGFIPQAVGDEPFQKLRNQGMILGDNGQKMSKSRGNVINPDEIVQLHGADTLRVYEMFMGPFEDAKPWSTDSVIGTRRWLDRVWRLAERVSVEVEDDPKVRDAVERAVAKVTADIDEFKFNTAISSLMIASNTLAEAPQISASIFQRFLQLLAPFAPHLAQELYAQTGGDGLIEQHPWPVVDVSLLTKGQIQFPVQVNGKVRDILDLETGLPEQAVLDAALASDKVQHHLEGHDVVKTIFVPGKILNLIARRKDSSEEL